MKKFLIAVLAVVCVVSIVANILLFERYSSRRALINVNGQVISRKDFDDRVDYLYSKDILRKMIMSDLILQEAKKENVVPTDRDVADEIAILQRSQPQVISAAKQTDPTLKLFNQTIKTKLALINLRIKGISVSDGDVKDFYNQHRATFHLPQQTSSMVVIASDNIAAQSALRLMQNNVSSQVIAGQSGLKVVGYNAPPIYNLPAPISKSILTMKTGDTRAFPVGSQFLVVKVKSVAPAAIPPLESIKPQVEMAAKVAKAPSENAILVRLVSEAHIKAESDKYAGAIPKVGTAVASAQ